MKFQKIFITIAISTIVVLMVSCGNDIVHPVAGDDIDLPTDNPGIDSSGLGNLIDSSDLGVGPDVIPNGESDIGTSDMEDGSAARRALYGVPQYFWGDMGNGTEIPLVKITHAVTSEVVDIEVIFNPAFVDNTYGTGCIGWSSKRGHTFRDLYSSDHVEVAVTNNNGDVVWKGRVDLLSQTTNVSTGYACLGPFGGDGRIEVGDGSAVLSFGSSLDDNINYYGYHLFENSPQTDSTFKPNPLYPNWQFYVSYRLTFDASVFGASGYGKIEMTSVHASPSKGSDTVPVTEKPGPVPGTSEDPFQYFNPPVQVIPGDTIPIDSIPGDNDPGYGVG